jgi:ribosomal protein S27E
MNDGEIEECPNCGSYEVYYEKSKYGVDIYRCEMCGERLVKNELYY